MLEGSEIPESLCNVGMLTKAGPMGSRNDLQTVGRSESVPLGSQSGPVPSRMLGFCFFGSPVLI